MRRVREWLRKVMWRLGSAMQSWRDGFAGEGIGLIGAVRIKLPAALRGFWNAIRGKEIVVRSAGEFRKEMKGSYSKGELVKIIMWQNKVIAEYVKKHGDGVIRKMGPM